MRSGYAFDLAFEVLVKLVLSILQQAPSAQLNKPAAEVKVFDQFMPRVIQEHVVQTWRSKQIPRLARGPTARPPGRSSAALWEK